MENEKPLVSVIIPMYNTEKYIAECLESVLSQTLKDFEVILVNNCSTDESANIAEGYTPKFEGRLKIFNMEENSGYPGSPRNYGLEMATGKYIYFMDSDDVITTDALENLYETAEKTQADVLICKRFLTSNGEGENFLKDIVLKGDKKDNMVDLFAENLESRVKHYIKGAAPHLPVAPWAKFILRDFLVENKINFLLTRQEDSIWSFEIICLAKKIVLVPYVCYIYREYPESVVNAKLYNSELTPESVHDKFDRIIKGIKHVDNFMGEIEFFQKNPQFRFAVLELMVSQNTQMLYANYKKYPPSLIYEKFKEAFSAETGDFDVLIAMLVAHSLHIISDLSDKKTKRFR